MPCLRRLARSMPLFSFRTQEGQRSSASDACELESPDAAWKELTRICGDLIGGRCQDLRQNSEWSVEALDAAERPLFRIRLVAETVFLAVLACTQPLLDAAPLLV